MNRRLFLGWLSCVPWVGTFFANPQKAIAVTCYPPSWTMHGWNSGHENNVMTVFDTGSERLYIEIKFANGEECLIDLSGKPVVKVRYLDELRHASDYEECKEILRRAFA